MFVDYPTRKKPGARGVRVFKEGERRERDKI
jgi:hypothetical protein